MERFKINKEINLHTTLGVENLTGVEVSLFSYMFDENMENPIVRLNLFRENGVKGEEINHPKNKLNKLVLSKTEVNEALRPLIISKIKELSECTDISVIEVEETVINENEKVIE